MFDAWDATLVNGDTNGSRDIFVKNLNNGATSRVSLGKNGVQPNSYSEHGTWSPDGSLIAFSSKADNLVSGDINADEDVYVRHLASGQVALISTTYKGEPSLFDHRRPHWSPDGTRIAFMSEGVNLLPGTVDTNQRVDIYIKNLVTGMNQVVSITADKRFGERRFEPVPRRLQQQRVVAQRQGDLLRLTVHEPVERRQQQLRRRPLLQAALITPTDLPASRLSRRTSPR